MPLQEETQPGKRRDNIKKYSTYSTSSRCISISFSMLLSLCSSDYIVGVMDGGSLWL